MKSYNEMNYVEYNRNLVLFLLFCLMGFKLFCIFIYVFIFLILIVLYINL